MSKSIQSPAGCNFYAPNGLYDLPALSSSALTVIDKANFFGKMHRTDIPTVMGASGCILNTVITVPNEFNLSINGAPLNSTVFEFSDNASNPLNPFACLFWDASGYHWGFDDSALDLFVSEFVGHVFSMSEVYDFTDKLGLVYPNIVDSTEGMGICLPKQLMHASIDINSEELLTLIKNT